MNADSRTSAAARADVDALIDEGLAATGILPTYERLVELDEQLRAAIDKALPVAQAKADELNRGTPEWYSRQTAIDEARKVLAGNLGAGLRSAAMHVAELARRCYALQGRH
ncbi:DUF6415 family natural product biosynthesis protein [Streptomyces chartreusis]|uniref:DUF6415 family natural product biosynthesis protein n=1 Tax=Streptomyces chartreusis TaxID=1969 RepID=UPI0033E53993